MAGEGSKRARSTSAAVDGGGAHHAAPAPQRRKRTRSPPLEEAASQESDDVMDDRRQPEASTSRPSKPKAAPRNVTQQQPKQTLRRQESHNSSNASITPADVEGSQRILSQSTDTNKAAASSTAQQSRKTGERAAAVHRTSGANGRGTLVQEYADLQARHEEQQINYNALREAYQALQELRETGAEATLREVTARNEGRLNAMRKQVANYKKESEELQAQADALKEEIATLSDRQEGNADAAGNDKAKASRRSNGDDDNDEEQEQEDDDDASMDASQEASTSNKALTTSNRKLDAAILNLQTELEESTQKNGRLQEEVDDLLEQLEKAKKEKRALTKQWAGEREHLELLLKEKWEKEKRTLLQEKEELAARSTQLEKELAFEIEQSKKLQAIAGSASTSSQLKAAPKTPSTTAIQPTSDSSSASSDELVQLLLDFTGMTLVRRPQEGDKTYNFVMTDFKKRKALNFKLIVDHESGMVDFIPDLLPGRDDEVIESMENAIRGHIKFEYDLMIQTFFKRLWRALNGHR